MKNLHLFDFVQFYQSPHSIHFCFIAPDLGRNPLFRSLIIRKIKKELEQGEETNFKYY